MSPLFSPWCISAYVIRKTEDDAYYLLIRRCGTYLPGTWQMVSGGIEPGETASAAALREIQEETGLIPSSFYTADAVETFYMESQDRIALVPVFVAFVEEESVRLSPKEHDAYEWLSFEEARDRLIWTEQKRVITHIHHTFVLSQPSTLLTKDPLPPIHHRMISRTGVYALVMRQQKILLVKQIKGPYAGKWELPGGGIEPGETIETALRRELREEIGMEFDSMTPFLNLTTLGSGDGYALHQIGLIYHIDGASRLSDEPGEMEYAWIDKDQLDLEKISPFVRQSLLQKIGKFR